MKKLLERAYEALIADQRMRETAIVDDDFPDIAEKADLARYRALKAIKEWKKTH